MWTVRKLEGLCMSVRAVVSSFQDAEFEFASVEAAELWEASGSRIGFTFYVGNADEFESIFGDVEDEEICVRELAAGTFTFSRTGSRVRVSASVAFEWEMTEAVSVERFQAWVDDEGGWCCPSLYPMSEASLLQMPVAVSLQS
jgi:hypothetical protein